MSYTTPQKAYQNFGTTLYAVCPTFFKLAPKANFSKFKVVNFTVRTNSGQQVGHWQKEKIDRVNQSVKIEQEIDLRSCFFYFNFVF